MHICDATCVCPLDRRSLIYSPSHDLHACPNRACKNRLGLRLVHPAPAAPTKKEKR